MDAEYLLALARDRTVEGRVRLAEVMAGLFDNDSRALSDRERHLMFNIMRGLIHEVETSVKRSLSALMAERDDAPRDLISELANGDMDVAYPVLTRSNVLRDHDLVDIVRLRTHEHQLAITLRKDISEAVSDALIEHGDEDVIVSLLNNDEASISDAAMAFVVEESRRVDTFQEPLLHRTDLTEDLAQKMFTWVSDALRDHIVTRYRLDAATVDGLIRQAAEEATQENQGVEGHAGEVLSQALDEAGMVTPDMVVAALMNGEASLFLHLFSTLTKLDERLASRIVFDDGGEALAIACKAVDVSEMQFALIFKRSRRAQPRRPVPRRPRGSEPQVLDLYRRTSKLTASRVLQQWQRGPDFFTASKEAGFR